ncbi:MAG: hypothetical protein AB7H71_05975 [Alphaproteobacteria bacterium]
MNKYLSSTLSVFASVFVLIASPATAALVLPEAGHFARTQGTCSDFRVGEAAGCAGFTSFKFTDAFGEHTLVTSMVSGTHEAPAQASAIVGQDVYHTLGAFITGPGGSADASVTYYVGVDGNWNGSVPVFVEHTGGIVISTFGGGGGSATVKVEGPGVFYQAGTCVTIHIADVHCFGSDSNYINGSESLRMNVGQAYRVTIAAGARAEWGTLDSIAWADPYFYIDPTFEFADQLTIRVSDGIGNSPISAVSEPSSLAIVIGCLSLLALTRVRS